MTIPFEEFKTRLLADPKVRREYDALAPEFEISAELLRARLRAGLSQAELAKLMRTSQSAVAAWESGARTPGVEALERLARACAARGSAKHRAVADGERRAAREAGKGREGPQCLGVGRRSPETPSERT